MRIKFEDEYQMGVKQVVCDIHLTAGEIHLIEGENGIGKTSFVHFLKLGQDRFFPNEVVRFIDQLPLSPLNDISFYELKQILLKKRSQEISYFEEFEKRIIPFERQPIKNLSGGQNQLVKIATALYLGGDYFFFDEPFQYLDKANKELLKKTLFALKSEKRTVILIEHNRHLVSELCDSYIQIIENDKVRLSNGL